MDPNQAASMPAIFMQHYLCLVRPLPGHRAHGISSGSLLIDMPYPRGN